MNKTCSLKWGTLFILLVVLGGGCTIPFYFESPSIYYKTGMDKFMLRTGKVLGILAALLMFFQLIFIGRFSALDKIWGFKNLLLYHRINGVILLIVALIHPMLILGADHFVLFPMESKYWPEFVGVSLLVMLILFVGISHWQKVFAIPYKTWRGIHKRMAPVLLCLMFVHVFNVSRTFQSGIPFYAAGAVAVLVVCLVIRKHFK